MSNRSYRNRSQVREVAKNMSRSASRGNLTHFGSRGETFWGAALLPDGSSDPAVMASPTAPHFRELGTPLRPERRTTVSDSVPSASVDGRVPASTGLGLRSPTGSWPSLPPSLPCIGCATSSVLAPGSEIASAPPAATTSAPPRTAAPNAGRQFQCRQVHHSAYPSHLCHPIPERIGRSLDSQLLCEAYNFASWSRWIRRTERVPRKLDRLHPFWFRSHRCRTCFGRRIAPDQRGQVAEGECIPDEGAGTRAGRAPERAASRPSDIGEWRCVLPAERI